MTRMMGAWRAAPRRLAGLVRTVWPRRGLVAEACVTLLVVETRLKLRPLKRQGLRDLVSGGGSPAAGQAGPEAPAERQAALEIGWAVSRIAHYFPSSAMCLAQALAARAMLDRRGIESILHVGVARSGADPFAAHAWLEAAGAEVTGYPVAPHFREIGCLFSDGGGSR